MLGMLKKSFLQELYEFGFSAINIADYRQSWTDPFGFDGPSGFGGEFYHAKH